MGFTFKNVHSVPPVAELADARLVLVNGSYLACH